jgi:hypothetical protein
VRGSGTQALAVRGQSLQAGDFVLDHPGGRVTASAENVAAGHVQVDGNITAGYVVLRSPDVKTAGGGELRLNGQLPGKSVLSLMAPAGDPSNPGLFPTQSFQVGNAISARFGSNDPVSLYVSPGFVDTTTGRWEVVLDALGTKPADDMTFLGSGGIGTRREWCVVGSTSCSALRPSEIRIPIVDPPPTVFVPQALAPVYDATFQGGRRRSLAPEATSVGSGEGIAISEGCDTGALNQGQLQCN